MSGLFGDETESSTFYVEARDATEARQIVAQTAPDLLIQCVILEPEDSSKASEPATEGASRPSAPAKEPRPRRWVLVTTGIVVIAISAVLVNRWIAVGEFAGTWQYDNVETGRRATQELAGSLGIGSITFGDRADRVEIGVLGSFLHTSSHPATGGTFRGSWHRQGDGIVFSDGWDEFSEKSVPARLVDGWLVVKSPISLTAEYYRRVR